MTVNDDGELRLPHQAAVVGRREARRGAAPTYLALDAGAQGVTRGRSMLEAADEGRARRPGRCGERSRRRSSWTGGGRGRSPPLPPRPGQPLGPRAPRRPGARDSLGARCRRSRSIKWVRTAAYASKRRLVNTEPADPSPIRQGIRHLVPPARSSLWKGHGGSARADGQRRTSGRPAPH